MRARDVMTTALVTVTPSTSVKEAARLLVENGFTTLPVVDGAGGLAGVVTDVDVLRDRIAVDPRALVHGDWPVPAVRGPAPSLVGEVMTSEVVARSQYAQSPVVVVRPEGQR